MTKEEVLQKVNDYCNEKSYTSSTFTDGFKEKFADHFVKANEDGNIEDENVLANMKFALNSAWSSASEIIADKTKTFETKETGYKNQIAELNKKIAELSGKQQPTFELPQDIKDKLDELEKFKNEQSKQEKFKNIVSLAKQSIRQDLHGSFDKYVSDYQVKVDAQDQDQANALVAKFQEIFKDSIGNIKPLAPQQTQKRDEEILAGIGKVKVI